MNFAQLRAFRAVAETGSVTRAAERLRVSQPAVTVQIKSLEEAYDVELFHTGSIGVCCYPISAANCSISRGDVLPPWTRPRFYSPNRAASTAAR